MKRKDRVLFPVQAPWAQHFWQLKNGFTKYHEFRGYKPSFAIGATLLVIETGEAPKPRRVIGILQFMGASVVSFKDKKYYIGNDVVPKEYLEATGGKVGDYAWEVEDIRRYKYPQTIESFGLNTTPQKYTFMDEAYEGLVWKEGAKTNIGTFNQTKLVDNE